MPARLLVRGAATVLVTYWPATSAAQDSLKLDAVYAGDVLGVVSGGLRKNGRWMGRGDILVDENVDAFRKLSVTAHLDLMVLHGGGLSANDVGDSQVVSNIDAHRAVRLYEAWLEAPLSSDTTLRAGIVDLNAQFDGQGPGTGFVNSSFGVGPDLSQSGRGGPSIFPQPTVAVVFNRMGRAWSWRVGAFSAGGTNPDRPGQFLPDVRFKDGALLIAELGTWIGKVGEARVGGWAYTVRTSAITRPALVRRRGLYVQMTRQLAGAAHHPVLQGWVRFGMANSEALPIGKYLGGGLTWGKSGSFVGIGVAHAVLGHASRKVFFDQGSRPAPAETIIELTMRLPLSERAALQPDVQFVQRPSWAPATHAIVAGARLHWHLRTGD